MLLDSEIAEERSVKHLGLRVKVPDGHADVTHVCRTIPMPVWRLRTLDFEIRSAGKHLVRGWQQFVPVDQVRENNLVLTESGWQLVLECGPTGEVEEMYDLRVDSEEHTYYTNGIVSHNSTGLCAAELFKFCVLPRYKSIYVAPLKEHTKTIADTMLTMQRGSIYPPSYFLRKGYRNNMYYKESPQGGFIKLLNILTDPTKIRGNSAQTVVVDEAQDFDSDHLPEIRQVQKAFASTKITIFAGTSKDLDTCLEAQYRDGSGAVWIIPCGCKAKFHSLGDAEIVEGMMTPDGLRCPVDFSRRLNPLAGEFVHERPSRLEINRPSFHLPQVIVPQYAQGVEFSDIWSDFLAYPRTKFLREVWGIATETGLTELNERDLKKCCTDKTFAQTQKDYLSGRVKYVKVFSGVDWGGSDHEPAYKSKLSYTVHTIYGMRPDGTMDLIYAFKYSGMHYLEIAQQIVEQHLKYKAFAMGTDNGGGAYYNAHMRDCGRIPTNLIAQFQYTDTRLILDKIKHPEWLILSLHRSDSISALIEDIKAQRISWPRWDDSAPFVLDCLNVRRNITEAPSGRTIMRYIKHGSRADDFLMSTNYACMMKRIINREPMIPNKQVVEELREMFGISIPTVTAGYSELFDEGHFSG